MELAVRDTRTWSGRGDESRRFGVPELQRHYPDFRAAAFGTTVETEHATLLFTTPAPLFRGEPPAQHSLVFVTDRKTGQQFAVDIIATGGATIHSDTRDRPNPFLRRLDRARSWVFETVQGEPPLRDHPTVQVLTDTEAVRLLDTPTQNTFNERLAFSPYGKTLVVRTALRFGAGPSEVIAPDQAASPEAIRRGLGDIARAINSPLSGSQLRSLEIPDIRSQFSHEIMELPGGFHVYEARTIRREEGEMLLYPVIMRRLLATGEMKTDYFEVLTRQPLNQVRQKADLTLGIESFCTCMNTGGRGCNCYSQVDPRIRQSEVVIYGVLQTDLGYGEVSRSLIDNIRARDVEGTTGLPHASTEDARHELFGLPAGERIPDLRDHDETAMLAANLFPRAAGEHGSITLTTSNIAKGLAFMRRFLNIHFEESPEHENISDHERELERQRLALAGTPYVRRAPAVN